MDAAARRRARKSAHLFHGFRTNLRALLPIGVVLVAGTILAVLATALVDGGALLDMISARGKPDEAIVASPRIEIAMLFGIACALPTLLAVWFAPALVVFQDCGARRALATSLRAALANWRPLAVYGLLLFFYGAVLPGMAIAIIAVVAPSEGALYVIALLIGRSLLSHVLCRAGDLRLRRVSRHLPSPAKSRCRRAPTLTAP